MQAAAGGSTPNSEPQLKLLQELGRSLTFWDHRLGDSTGDSTLPYLLYNLPRHPTGSSSCCLTCNSSNSFPCLSSWSAVLRFLLPSQGPDRALGAETSSTWGRDGRTHLPKAPRHKGQRPGQNQPTSKPLPVSS